MYIQASEEYAHDYSTCTKKKISRVTCYLVFSSQPSSRPWIISMLFLILSYTTEIKQFSAAWILKWK